MKYSGWTMPCRTMPYTISQYEPTCRKAQLRGWVGLVSVSTSSYERGQKVPRSSWRDWRMTASRRSSYTRSTSSASWWSGCSLGMAVGLTMEGALGTLGTTSRVEASMGRSSIGSAQALAAAILLLFLSAAAEAQVKGEGSPPTIEQARAFLEETEPRLLDLSNRQGRADWVSQTYITDDTEKISAEAAQALIAVTMDRAEQATRVNALSLPEDIRRKLTLLKLAAIPLPAPSDPKLQAELTETTKWMEGVYGKGKYCRGPNRT